MSPDDELLSAFHGFRDALMANDIERLDALLAQDYRGYNLRGGLEGRELILQVYSPGVVTMDRFETDDLRIEVHGDIGIITGKGYVAGSAGGERWEHELRFCDVYRHGDTGWQLYLSHATEIAGE